jgi:hypothetical protein
MLLPVELIIEIVECLVPQSDLTPVVGENAAWTDVDKFAYSLWVDVPKDTAELKDGSGDENREDGQVDAEDKEEGTKEAAQKKISVYSSLLALNL